MCISYLPKRRLLENSGNGKFWGLWIWKFSYCEVFFAFFSCLASPSFCFHSTSTVSACKTTAHPVFLLLWLCSALFKSSDTFSKTFLWSTAAPEATSLKIPSSWMHCQSRYVITPFKMETVLQSMLRVQTSVSLSEAKNWVVHSKFSVSSQCLITDIPKALTCFHIHSVKSLNLETLDKLSSGRLSSL